jgi:hypothetical protein
LLIVGTAFALLASYKEFRQLTESIMTILAFAGFLLTIWQIYPNGCASDPWCNFSAKLSCPNRREFLRKFVEFAPRGAFQARIPGDFSPFERNRASLFAETLLLMSLR